MNKRITAFACALALCMSLLPIHANAADEIAAKTTQDNGNPYYIMVNRAQSTVTVYGLDEHGYYTVPVRAMICSTGAASTRTPRGNFAIGKKIRWNLMMGDVYAQYLSQFHNQCLFHSVCYARANPSALLAGYYNALGRPASHGCVRLQTEDAKWIYDNCDAGTLVTVYDGAEPGELGKPERMVDVLTAKNNNGWDPTDPDPANPWAARRTEGIGLSDYELRLLPGEEAVLDVFRWPEETRYPTVTFRSGDPSVALVDGAGRIRAVAVGKTSVTAVCGEVEQTCTVAVTDDVLPFCDVAPGLWFYQDVRYLYERGVISGGAGYEYAPDGVLAPSEALQLLYNLAGKPAIEADEAPGAGEPAERLWYADAVEWAAASGVAPEAAESELDASPALTKGELIELLFRYNGLLPTLSGGSGSAVAIQASAGPRAEDAVPAALDWALETGLLLGDEAGELALDTVVTRAQAAALLHRYCDLFDAQIPSL